MNEITLDLKRGKGLEHLKDFLSRTIFAVMCRNIAAIIVLFVLTLCSSKGIKTNKKYDSCIVFMGTYSKHLTVEAKEDWPKIQSVFFSIHYTASQLSA